MFPKRPISQVFMSDPRAVSRIVDCLGLPEGSGLLEVGSGEGALTRGLLDRGYRVLAVERDARLALGMAKRMACKDLVQVIADIRKFPLDRAARGGWPFVVGNLPYHITGKIMRAVYSVCGELSGAVFTIQREVAQRMTTPVGPGRSLLSVATEIHTQECRILFDLAPSVFRPAPAVWSSVIRMIFRKEPLMDNGRTDKMFSMLKILFHQKRKTLKNTLGLYEGSKEKASEILEGCGISSDRRPESLTLDEVVRLGGMIT